MVRFHCVYTVLFDDDEEEEEDEDEEKEDEKDKDEKDEDEEEKDEDEKGNDDDDDGDDDYNTNDDAHHHHRSRIVFCELKFTSLHLSPPRLPSQAWTFSLPPSQSPRLFLLHSHFSYQNFFLLLSFTTFPSKNHFHFLIIFIF